jgi:predicted DNA-binding transcriptional regulator AlpA
MDTSKTNITRRACSIEETAAFFGKERSWAYRQVKAGRIKVITGYGAMLVPAAEIDRILNFPVSLK